jgi:hypothetical protein
MLDIKLILFESLLILTWCNFPILRAESLYLFHSNTQIFYPEKQREIEMREISLILPSCLYIVWFRFEWPKKIKTVFFN